MVKPGRQSSLPRLRDIAGRAGVSVNTVSRALTGKPDVNAETRVRILALAEEVGYTPNLHARSLLRGRSSLVGVVVTDCTDPFYAGLIRATEAALSKGGYGMLLATSNEDSGKESRALTVLREHRVDGILLTAVDVEADHVQALLEGRTPVVLLGRRKAGYDGPSIGTDNVAGADLLVHHLVEEGHARIAHVTRDTVATSADERLRGYRNALQAACIPFDEDLVFAAPPTVEGGQAAAAWVAQHGPHVTAITTYNDSQAVGLVQELQRRGHEVPRDYSVAGFDNIQLSHLIRPSLTTIAQPVDEIGATGAELLMSLMDGHAAPQPILLSPALVVRDSTAPAPGAASSDRVSSGAPSPDQQGRQKQ